jgi:hypothetical protein
MGMVPGAYSGCMDPDWSQGQTRLFFAGLWLAVAVIVITAVWLRAWLLRSRRTRQAPAPSTAESSELKSP